MIPLSVDIEVDATQFPYLLDVNVAQTIRIAPGQELYTCVPLPRCSYTISILSPCCPKANDDADGSKCDPHATFAKFQPTSRYYLRVYTRSDPYISRKLYHFTDYCLVAVTIDSRPRLSPLGEHYTSRLV